MREYKNARSNEYCATLRVKDAVIFSGVCKTKLYELIGDGTLQTVKVGRARLILRSSLDALLTPEVA